MTVPLLPPPVPFSMKQVALPPLSTPSASAKMSPAGHGLVPKAIVFVFPQTRHAKVASPSDGDTTALGISWIEAQPSQHFEVWERTCVEELGPSCPAAARVAPLMG